MSMSILGDEMDDKFPDTPELECTCGQAEAANSNVVSLDTEGQDSTLYIAVCINCGCRSFELLSSGQIECCNCGQRPTGYEEEVEWRRVLPEEPKNPDDVEGDGGTIGVRSMGVADIAMHSTMKVMNEWTKAGNATMLIAFGRDGAGKHWFDIHTEEQKEWVLRRLREVTAHIEKLKV